MAAVPLRRAVASLYRRAGKALPRPARFALDGAEAAVRGNPNLIRHLDLTAGLARRRLRPDRLFVGWLCHGDENDGGSRVHALRLQSFLRRHGVNSVMLRKPKWSPDHFWFRDEDFDRIVRAAFDVVVFQGVYGPDAERLARALKGASTRTVYVTGDLFKNNMPALVDWLVVASEGLKAIASGYLGKTSIIESVIDAPPRTVKDYSRPPQRDEIRVVWTGYPTHLHTLEPVREALRDPRLARFKLITISRGPDVTFQWDRKRVCHQILDCDIAVLPSAETDWFRVKPNTRMTMFKALGLPIVASPIPSYRETLTHGTTCYFAQDVVEWANCLAALADFDHRRQIGLADRERILATYGIEAICRRWVSLFERLAGRRREARVVHPASQPQDCRRS
jgi:glycosyltransferase involved in cell wall biosynthesis